MDTITALFIGGDLDGVVEDVDNDRLSLYSGRGFLYRRYRYLSPEYNRVLFIFAVEEPGVWRIKITLHELSEYYRTKLIAGGEVPPAVYFGNAR